MGLGFGLVGKAARGLGKAWAPQAVRESHIALDKALQAERGGLWFQVRRITSGSPHLNKFAHTFTEFYGGSHAGELLAQVLTGHKPEAFKSDDEATKAWGGVFLATAMTYLGARGAKKFARDQRTEQMSAALRGTEAQADARIKAIQETIPTKHTRDAIDKLVIQGFPRTKLADLLDTAVKAGELGAEGNRKLGKAVLDWTKQGKPFAVRPLDTKQAGELKGLQEKGEGRTREERKRSMELIGQERGAKEAHRQYLAEKASTAPGAAEAAAKLPSPEANVSEFLDVRAWDRVQRARGEKPRVATVPEMAKFRAEMADVQSRRRVMEAAGNTQGVELGNRVAALLSKDKPLSPAEIVELNTKLPEFQRMVTGEAQTADVDRAMSRKELATAEAALAKETQVMSNILAAQGLPSPTQKAKFQHLKDVVAKLKARAEGRAEAVETGRVTEKKAKSGKQKIEEVDDDDLVMDKDLAKSTFKDLHKRKLAKGKLTPDEEAELKSSASALTAAEISSTHAEARKEFEADRKGRTNEQIAKEDYADEELVEGEAEAKPAAAPVVVKKSKQELEQDDLDAVGGYWGEEYASDDAFMKSFRAAKKKTGKSAEEIIDDAEAAAQDAAKDVDAVGIDDLRAALDKMAGAAAKPTEAKPAKGKGGKGKEIETVEDEDYSEVSPGEKKKETKPEGEKPKPEKGKKKTEPKPEEVEAPEANTPEEAAALIEGQDVAKFMEMSPEDRKAALQAQKHKHEDARKPLFAELGAKPGNREIKKKLAVLKDKMGAIDEVIRRGVHEEAKEPRKPRGKKKVAVEEKPAGDGIPVVEEGDYEVVGGKPKTEGEAKTEGGIPTVEEGDYTEVGGKPSPTPEWLKENIEAFTKEADTIGATAEIIDLAKQKQTAAQIVTALKAKYPTITKDMVRAVRSKHGIDAADEAADIPTTTENEEINKRQAAIRAQKVTPSGPPTGVETELAKQEREARAAEFLSRTKETQHILDKAGISLPEDLRNVLTGLAKDVPGTNTFREKLMKTLRPHRGPDGIVDQKKLTEYLQGTKKEYEEAKAEREKLAAEREAARVVETQEARETEGFADEDVAEPVREPSPTSGTITEHPVPAPPVTGWEGKFGKAFTHAIPGMPVVVAARKPKADVVGLPGVKGGKKRDLWGTMRFATMADFPSKGGFVGSWHKTQAEAEAAASRLSDVGGQPGGVDVTGKIREKLGPIKPVGLPPPESRKGEPLPAEMQVEPKTTAEEKMAEKGQREKRDKARDLAQTGDISEAFDVVDSMTPGRRQAAMYTYIRAAQAARQALEGSMPAGEGKGGYEYLA